MEARELRIGNYINYVTYGGAEPSKVTFDLLSRWQQDNRLYSPIPLTEEFFLKHISSDNCIILEEMQIMFEDGGYYLADNDGLGVGVDYIKYVHKLQNLIYELTNEELTINL